MHSVEMSGGGRPVQLETLQKWYGSLLGELQLTAIDCNIQLRMRSLKSLGQDERNAPKVIFAIFVDVPKRLYLVRETLLSQSFGRMSSLATCWTEHSYGRSALAPLQDF